MVGSSRQTRRFAGCSNIRWTCPSGAASTHPNAASARPAPCETFVLARESRKPLVLVLEDIHWIDPGEPETLDTLVDSLALSRVLVARYVPAGIPAELGPA